MPSPWKDKPQNPYKVMLVSPSFSTGTQLGTFDSETSAKAYADEEAKHSRKGNKFMVTEYGRTIYTTEGTQ